MIVTMKIFGRIVLLRNSTPVLQIADTADRHRCIFTFSPICMYSKLREAKNSILKSFLRKQTVLLTNHPRGFRFILLMSSLSYRVHKILSFGVRVWAGGCLGFSLGKGDRGSVFFWLSHSYKGYAVHMAALYRNSFPINHLRWNYHCGAISGMGFGLSLSANENSIYQKMTGGTPEVRSDKKFNLNDIQHLKFN